MDADRYAGRPEVVPQRSAYERWLGIHLLRVAGAAVELVVPYRDEFEGVVGYIHPAIIVAIAHISIATLPQPIDARLPGLASNLELLAPVLAGNELYAHTWISNGKVHIEIRTNDDRALVARATLSTPTHRGENSAATPVTTELQLVYPI